MTVETYVILSLDKFHHLDEKARSKVPEVTKEHSVKETSTLTDEPLAEDSASQSKVNSESEPVDDVPEPPEEKAISEKTKTLVKKKTVLQRHFEKLLGELEKFNGTELAISNLKQLIKAALGQSPRVLPNEQKFYSLLLQHDLFHLVKNKHKIKKFYPGWFRIG